MCKKIILVILFLFPSMHGMELELPQIPMDLWSAIINYAIGQEKKYYHLWPIVNRNYTLQLVCKDFERMFWDCFSLNDKDFVIHRLLHWNRKDCRDTLDIAVRIQARVYPILKYAIRNRGDLECVRVIIAIGDTHVINAIDNSGSYPVTPLTLAIRFKQYDIVQLLLNCPLTDVNVTVPLYEAAHRKNVEMINLLLAHPKTQINAVTEDGETALFAISNDSCDNVDNLRFIIDLLLNAGIDTSIKNIYDQTVLDVARYEAQAVVAQELEHALAKKNNL